MKLEKIITGCIFSLTLDEAKKLMNKAEKNETFTCEEKQKFLVYTTSYNTMKYMVLDNTQGRCLQVYATNLEDAISYICDIPGIAVELEATYEILSCVC